MGDWAMRPDFLTGAVDLHIHSGPDIMTRIGSSIDIARDCANAGMRAIVLKDHLFPSVTKAQLTQEMVPEIRVFGGVTLNMTSGGLNPRSVKAALAIGAKIVMFPTFNSLLHQTRTKKLEMHVRHLFEEPQQFIPILDNGRLVPEAEYILQILVDYPDAVLSTGHLPPEEAVAVVERASELGIKRIVVEHPNSGTEYEEDTWVRLVKGGAMLNVSYNACHPALMRKDPHEAVRLIRVVGTKHVCLISDAGQVFNPMPAEALRFFCEMLVLSGMTPEEIMPMVKDNPARVLGLDDPQNGAVSTGDREKILVGVG